MLDYIHDHIDNLTPYYLVLAESGHIINAGKAFTAINKSITGKQFQHIFKIQYQDNLISSDQDLALFTEKQLSISYNQDEKIKLNGKLYYSQSMEILYFVGTPDLNTYQYVAQKGVGVSSYREFNNNQDIIDHFTKRETFVSSFLKMNATILSQQKQLEQERNEYINIVESLEVIVFKTDANGNLLFLNKAWEKILGYTVEESLYTFASSYIHPDDRATGIERFTEIKKGIRKSSEHVERFFTKTNEIKWLRIYAKPLWDDNNYITGATGTFTDVTKEIENEKKLELILNNVRDEISLIDINDQYTFVSPSLVSNRGFENLDDFINNNTINTMHPDDQHRIRKAVMEEGQTKMDFEYRIKMKSGEYQWYSGHSKLIKDKTNDQQYLLTVARSIQEKQNLDKQFEIIANNINDEITMFDLEGNYLYASPSALKQRKYFSLEELQKTKAYQNVNMDDWISMMNHLLEKGTFYLEHTLLKNDGEYAWYESVLKLVKDELNNQDYIVVVARNIDERKKSEQQLELITNNISDEITMFDFDGNYMYASPSVIENRGYKNYDELKFLNAFSIISQELKETILYNIRKSGEFKTERKYLKHNGEIIWYESFIKLITDKLNNKEYILTVSRNIQDKKIQEQHLSLITNNLSDEISMFDMDGQYLYVTPSVLKKRGYKDFEEMKSKDAFSIITEEEKSLLKSKLLELGEYKMERKYIKPNGEYIWYDSYARLINDKLNNKQYIVSVARNITERKEAENKINLITANITDEVTMLDMDGSYLYATPSAIINKGFNNFAEMQQVNAFNHFSSEKVISILTELKEKGFCVFENLYINQNHETNWYEINMKLISDNLSDKQYILATSRNIDQRIQYKQSIESSLKKEIELNQLKSDFISTSSHEFKTPLAILKTYLEILNGSEYIRNKEGIIPFFDKYLNRMETEIDRMLTLMNDTLILEKAYNNLLFAKKSETDLLFTLINITERFNATNKAAQKIKVNVLCKKHKLINLDVQLIEHVFENLISNAFKYSRGKKNPELTISNNSENIVITIKDFGIGIPVEALEKLFTPFYRAINTKGIEGTGMGLSIVKKILEIHNGSIQIDSKENEGTTVNITIPY